MANVGTNAGHRFNCPLFPDGSLEFLPIPEDRELQGSHAVRYRDLRSFYRPATDLLAYVPRQLWDWPTHNDPEFETFTYGDNCETSSRGAALKGLRPGDRLAFLTRLERWHQGRATGRFEEALRLFQANFDARSQLLGPQHPATFRSQSSLANCFYAAAEYNEAIKLFQEILTARTRVLGASHPDTLRSLGSLANSYRAAGRH